MELASPLVERRPGDRIHQGQSHFFSFFWIFHRLIQTAGMVMKSGTVLMLVTNFYKGTFVLLAVQLNTGTRNLGKCCVSLLEATQFMGQRFSVPTSVYKG